MADLASRIAAEGLEFDEASARDGYLETRPYNVDKAEVSGPDRTDPANVVQLRFWVDSLPNRTTRITAEITHPRADDPSLPVRLNEEMSKPGDPGWDIFERILSGTRSRFGG